MNRIDQRFADLKAQGRRALIPYITAGDPAPAHTVDFMHALVRAGADIIELGVPFSDPMADGPVIQKACERALRHGVRLGHLFEMVREFRRDDAETPVVLMGYLNPVERFGFERSPTRPARPVSMACCSSTCRRKRRICWGRCSSRGACPRSSWWPLPLPAPGPLQYAPMAKGISTMFRSRA